MRGLILFTSMVALCSAAHGESFQGKASFYRARGMTCAHRSLPLGSYVRVTNLANHRSTMLLVSGRGPFVRGRIVDVSMAAADALGFRRSGVAAVRIETAAR